MTLNRAFTLTAMGLALCITPQRALATVAGFTDEASFSAALGGARVTIEDFESTPGGFSGTLLFPLTTVTCAGTTFCPNFFGVYNGSAPEGFRNVYFATPDSITFTFASAITAFGIDIRSLGSMGATDLNAVLSNSGSITLFTAHSGPVDGLVFAGLIDPAGFTSVTFTGTNHSDGIYFDRLQASGPFVADILVTPEPQSYVMMLGGLGALAGFGRRRK